MNDNVFLSIKNVSKIFTSKHKTIQALQDVSLDVMKGEVLGLLGPNGAGKTTLSNILASLHPPSSGDVLYDGSSIYTNIVDYRRKLGYCPQYPSLSPVFTLKENLEFHGKAFGLSASQIKENVERVTEQFSLQEYLNASSDILSGGYFRRFAMARALMSNPSFVIFDEPTVGLDPHIRRQVWDCIKGLKDQGITIILTTHYLDEAEVLSDRICFLDKGKVLFTDSVENVKNKNDDKSLEDIFVKLFND